MKNTDVVAPLWLFVLVVVGGTIAGAVAGAVFTANRNIKPFSQTIGVTIVSIQQPETKNGTHFSYGCVYETTNGERFFSQVVLGSPNDKFFVNPKVVGY